MKKILLATLLFIGVAVSSFAQNGNGKFSLGVETGLPVGSMSKYSNFIIGGSLKYDIPVSKTTNVTITAGYTTFLGKTVGNIDYLATHYIPVKAGIKYFFDKSFYGEAQLGAAYQTDLSGAFYFAYSPGIGYKFSDKIDLGIRYEAWSHTSTISQIGARLACSF